jgi:hypothetical protein
MTLRDKRQKEFADVWMKTKFGILNLCPRFGKIRVSINVFNKFPANSKILIAYPDGKIKESWLADFEALEYNNPNVSFTTHLSLKKHLEDTFDIIVIDEVHLLSEAQLEVCSELFNRNAYILGLTGTLSSNTERDIYQATRLSVVAEYPIEKAIEEGVIVDYEITVCTIPLDNKKVLDFKGKKRTEKKQFDAVSWAIDKMERESRNTMFMRLGRMRLIQKSYAKVEATKKLLNKYADERVLVFCGVTEVADSLGCPSYHSKSTEKQMFADFAEGKGKHMAVVKIGNTGVTYKPLNKVIINYFDSNGENMAQKIFRCMAMEYNNLNKKAEVIIVSSNEPVELKWLKRALEFFDKTKIKFVSL